MNTTLNTYIGKFKVETKVEAITTGSTNVRNLSTSNRKQRSRAKFERIENKYARKTQQAIDRKMKRAIRKAQRIE